MAFDASAEYLNLETFKIINSTDSDSFLELITVGMPEKTSSSELFSGATELSHTLLSLMEGTIF